MSFIDAKHREGVSPLHSDICIIGAGAAGITLAREFLNSKISVCVLESGDFNLDSHTQMLTAGWTKGNVLPENQWYLNTSRLRYFGGSTNHWDGWCRPLEPFDFKPRKWVPYSGWPITREDLNSYYGRAARICGVAPFATVDEEKADTRDPRFFDSSPQNKLETRLFHIPKSPVRFGQLYRDELGKSENVRVVLNANVVRINLTKSTRGVESVTVKVLGTGRNFLANAKIFILATGGVENARLLLLSNKIAKAGVGNSRDLVGRFFMDHPYFSVGSASVRASTDVLSSYRDVGLQKSINDMGIQAFCMKEEIQDQEQLLNASLFFRKPSKIKMTLNGPLAALKILDYFRKPFMQSWNDSTPVRLQVRTEQAPNPSSRVTLDTESDELGLRKSLLIWSISDLETKSALKLVKLLAGELGAVAKGHVKLFGRDLKSWKPKYGAHHMGTTRMSSDPSQGVVNENCRIHEVANLYVAGSSVFPTSGFANPTLTIVALALRLSEHLKTSFKQGKFT